MELDDAAGLNVVFAHCHCLNLSNSVVVQVFEFLSVLLRSITYKHRVQVKDSYSMQTVDHLVLFHGTSIAENNV